MYQKQHHFLPLSLDFWGIKKTQDELAKLCGTDMVYGTNDISIKRVAESFGLVAEIHNNSTFEDLHHWLAKGVPVIVDWFTRGRSDEPTSAVADGHYSVVVGLDDEHIYLCRIQRLATCAK